MGFWRREKPLHERLAREGGLDERPPHDPSPRWGEVGIHGVHRQREWDAVATVEVPDLEGTEASFVALPDGTLLSETEDSDLVPLADSLEATIAPPYRAHAVRRDGSLWAVAARRIRVEDVGEQIEGDSVVLTVRAGERALEIDGSFAFGSIPSLERLVSGDAVLVARHLDGTLWEVELTPL